MKKKYYLFVLLSVLIVSLFLFYLASIIPVQKPEKISGAMNALDFWVMQRAYPEKTIPDNKYYAAYEYSKQNLHKDFDNPLTSPWRDIGPKNNGGRTISILINPVNPNTIYVGSASGGLWRSYSGGIGVTAWQYINTSFPVLGVGAIAMNPQDTNTIYIGTGEVYGYQNSIGGLTIRTTRGSYGIGILKTTNNGNSWIKVLDWSYNQKRGVQVIKLNPLNPNVVWAGTTEGIFKSNNGGNNWTQISNVLMVTDILIHPTDTSKVLMACGNLGSEGTGLYKSMNSGLNWVQMGDGLPVSWGGKALFHYCRTIPNVVFASVGVGYNAGSYLCKSTNFGNNWIISSTADYASYQGWYSHYVVVHPNDTSQILTAGIDIWKSTDGGTNLIQKSNWAAIYQGRVPIGGPEGTSYCAYADQHAFAIHPTNPNIVYLVNDGGVFRTTDFGESYTGINGNYQTTQFYNGFSSSTTDSLFAIGGLQDNSTCIYDGQPAWLIRKIGGDGCGTAINKNNDSIVYGSYQYLSLMISHDRGNNFTSLGIGGGGTAGFLSPYILGINNPNIMYASKTYVFKSTDGGSTFAVINGGLSLDGNPTLSMGISYSNHNKLYICTAPVYYRSGLFRTTNGGENFVNITGNLPDRYPVDIVVDPQNDSKVYVALSGFGSSHLYKSTNSGDNWIDIGTGLPDVPTSAILIDPLFSDHIYIGNDLGVYLSTNGGLNWSEYSTGLPSASIIMDLSLVPTSRELRAATHGNGVYTRKLFGTVGIKQISTIVKDYKLEQNYPNPFNPTTIIKFQIVKNSFVTLKVYDILGKEVATIVKEKLSAGEYEIPFSINQYSRNLLSSGVYFYTIVAENFISTKKMLLIK
jgi:photosystem II stability/assembly factor-like uncharacterized protein